MHESIHLGKVRGIAVGLNWSVLVIAGLIAWSLAASYLPEVSPGYSTVGYWLVAVFAVVCFFASLLAHELAHSVVAQRQGVTVEGITLWLFGGVARLGGDPADSVAELKIATAGPAASVALTAVFAALASALDAAHGATLVVDAVAWLAVINGMLAVFNLAPAAPLDGGRILHAIVWRVTGDRNRATRVATDAGRVFGFVLVGGGIALFAAGFYSALWFAVIGWFVITAARAEATHALLRGALAGVRVRDVMTPDPFTAAASWSLDELLQEGFLGHHCSAFPVVDPTGMPVGLVTFRRLKAVPPDDRPHRTTADIAVPLERVTIAHPDDLVIEVLETMSPGAEGDGRILVFAGGALVGIVSPTDVNRALELASLRTPPPRD